VKLPEAGGIGSIRGALLAAILVGLIDTLGRAFLPNLLLATLSAGTMRANSNCADLQLVISAGGHWRSGYDAATCIVGFRALRFCPVWWMGISFRSGGWTQASVESGGRTAIQATGCAARALVFFTRERTLGD
jgi:hypothetical protein